MLQFERKFCGDAVNALFHDGWQRGEFVATEGVLDVYEVQRAAGDGFSG